MVTTIGHTVDSSVLVAAFASWHEHHALAGPALDGARLIGHAVLETYSVLTRLPPPHRTRGVDVARWLEQAAAGPALALDAETTTRLPARLAERGVVGGAAYDGLVAMTARQAGLRLLSLDVRAATNYRRLDVEHLLLA